MILDALFLGCREEWISSPSHLFNLSISLFPSTSGSEQHQVLCIQNSYEASTGSEGSEMYVWHFAGVFSACLIV